MEFGIGICFVHWFIKTRGLTWQSSSMTYYSSFFLIILRLSCPGCSSWSNCGTNWQLKGKEDDLWCTEASILTSILTPQPRQLALHSIQESATESTNHYFFFTTMSLPSKASQPTKMKAAVWLSLVSYRDFSSPPSQSLKTQIPVSGVV